MSNAGNMLRLARQLRGLQQKEACEKLGVNTPELSRIENGVKEPSQDVISAAASVFGLPESFFGQADTVYGAPVSIHPAQWRKKADVTAGDLHRVVAELNVRVMHLRRLLEATDFEPLRNVPRCDSDAYDNDGERVAAIVRGHWQVPEGPIRNLTALVEEAGIVVAHSDFGGSSISGVTFRVPGVPPLVVLNTMHPSDRMRFTLSHEVAHIVMHRFPTPEMEEEADEFASCFLAPTTDIKPYFDGRRVRLASAGGAEAGMEDVYGVARLRRQAHRRPQRGPGDLDMEAVRHEQLPAARAAGVGLPAGATAHAQRLGFAAYEGTGIFARRSGDCLAHARGRRRQNLCDRAPRRAVGEARAPAGDQITRRRA